ncbi:MAG: hypothetical protein OHK0022_33870 [Roseiflexaceae bacterium]
MSAITTIEEAFKNAFEQFIAQIPEDERNSEFTPGSTKIITMSFPFQLDDSGTFNFTEKRYVFGISVPYTLEIQSPELKYTITVTTSAGTNEAFENIGIDQPCSGTIATSVLGETVITTIFQADAKNVTGQATLSLG